MTDPFLVGIDVAWPQGPAVDWPSVERAGVSFAFCKATNGTTSVDSTFNRNRAAIRAETKISFGAYHWLEPAQDAIAQARHFVRTVGPLADIDVGLAIDFEDDDGGKVKGAGLLAGLLACAAEVTRLTGRKPLVYTGKWFYEGSVGFDSEEIASYPLWHAQYPSTKRDKRAYVDAVRALPADPSIASPWKRRGIKETFWQFDGDGGLFLPQGIDVDVNRFRGDSLAPFIESTRVGPALSLLAWGDVRAVQAALVACGFGLVVDGIWGPKPHATLLQFQALSGLVADGAINDETCATLERAVDSRRETRPDSAELELDDETT